MPEADRKAKDAWVLRVLGVEASAGQMGTIGFAKLQLRWRDAQQRAAASLRALGSALLENAEVQDDPRFPTVVQAVRTLPSLVPSFGDELADHLDDATNAGAGEAAKAHLRTALGTLARYRAQLTGVPALVALAEFGKRSVGVEVTAYQELDAALADIEREVSARAA